MDCLVKTLTGVVGLFICYLLLAAMPALAAQGELLDSVPVTATQEDLLDSAPVSAAQQEPQDSAPVSAAQQEPQDSASVLAAQQDPPDSASMATEQEAVAICDITTIDKVFAEYQRKAGSARIKMIQAQLKVGGYDPGYIDGLTGTETDRALAQLCVDFKVDEYFKDSEAAGTGEPEKRLASHLIKLLDEPEPIRLNGRDCGCSRDYSTLVYGTLVYGFYPYLLANGEEQEVDFSLLDRIGFHALVLDREGDIPQPLQWGNDNDADTNLAGFVNEAHKYRVKVDVTFYASDWQNWSVKTIDNAVSNIVETASRKFRSSRVNLWRKVFPLVEDNSVVSVDGVNLYFDDYTKPADSDHLVDIVERLARELKNRGSEAELRIMLGLDWSAVNSQQFEQQFEQQLKKLTGILVDDERKVKNVFIFLSKDSSKSKKTLRQIVENAFHGADRKTVLRKIVPIIDTRGVQENDPKFEDQFEDDLIYLKDNFAGVGLSPLPLASISDAEAIGEKLIRLYQVSADGSNYLGEIANRLAPPLCQFVCPNRWLFYVALDLMVGVLVVYALLALWNCRLRELFQRRFLYFLLPGFLTALIFVIVLACDPAWEERVDYVVIGFLLIVTVGFFWRYFRRLMQPPLP